MLSRRQRAANRARELVDEFGELGIRGVVGRRYDNRVARYAIDVSGTGIADEAIREGIAADQVAQGPLRRIRLLALAVAHQLDADEVTPAPHVADFLEPIERVPQVAAQRLAPDTDSG